MYIGHNAVRSKGIIPSKLAPRRSIATPTPLGVGAQGCRRYTLGSALADNAAYRARHK